MKILLPFFVFMLSAQFLGAQVTDDFSDGDYANNPAWTASAGDFVVNASAQLQSNNTTANSTFFITTSSTLATTAEWEFWANLAFSTSGSNYVDVFLTASSANLATASGYFVRIGNTDDEVSLYVKDASGVATKIIDGVNGTLGSNTTLKIKVTRNSANVFTLYRDLTGTGNSYTAEGSVTDASITTSSFFGILIKQSTASFFQKHFFDNIIVQAYTPDVTPPAISNIVATSSTSVDVFFDEPVDPTSAQNIANYSVSNGIGAPTSATIDAGNPVLVHLVFANTFPSNTNLTLTANGVGDLSGNNTNNATATFNIFVAQPYQIIINELMADPSPVVGLPDAEWLELRNNSGMDINLQGWRLGKATGLSGPMPSYILRADSFVVVTSTTNLAQLQAIAPAISVTSFPSLNNDGDVVFLLSNNGQNIHAVAYSSTWYQNPLKKDGGWSLEMIDPSNACSGSNNWAASTDASGGTPGKRNSVQAANPDTKAPNLINAYAQDETHIMLVFDEPINASAAQAASYQIDNGIGVAQTAVALEPIYNQVLLTLSAPLQHHIVYTVSVASLADCAGNNIDGNTAKVGLADPLDSLDLVVNEILFNPATGGYDFVEVYNRSNDIINLKNLYLANRNTTNNISSITQTTTTDRLLFPGEYMVFTQSVDYIKATFIAQNLKQFVEMGSMPSYSDASGNVILLNEQGLVVDEVGYSEKWHFPLISNREGVSLERINSEGKSNDPTNWHSASSSVGYATPTYKNSQSSDAATGSEEISLTPKVFSPDNDGQDDYLTINYNFKAPGSVANITIFDAAGRPVRYLQKNALNGLKGYYRWDGLGDKMQQLPVGMYVLLVEVFNLEGKTKQFKKMVVLARR